MTKAGPVWNGQIRFNAGGLFQPMRWRRPRRIFVCAHGDLFHEAVTDEMLGDVFGVMAEAQRHTFQVLTKRSSRIPHCIGVFCPVLENVWLGVSIEDRDRLFRLEDLRETPASIRFVSFEPLLEGLGELDLTDIDWAIVGGESGPGFRQMNPDWARSIKRQCEAQGVAFFFKQMSGKGEIPADLMVRQWPAAETKGER
jgi:protein gp37